jgi:hypothetical protein
MFREEFPDCRYEINGYLHRRVRRGLKRNLVFRDSFVFSLCFVVLKNAANAGFVPARRELSLVFHDFLLRRRRSACLALGPKS